MATTSYALTERVLRAKRRSFSKDLTTILEEDNSESGLSKERFEEKKAHFEHNWQEIVNSTEGCVKLIDDGDDNWAEQVSELNYQVKFPESKKGSIPSFGS